MSSSQEGSVHMPVLILHSDAFWGHSLTEFLSWEGYETQCASTAEAALAILDSHAVRFTVLMDNFAVQPQCQEFFAELRRRSDVRARVKVVGLSAVADEDLVWRDFGDVLDAHIRLPFSVIDLYNTLASL